ncbi:MAG: peptide-methionine (R)-S-oxide reductase MsrB [Bacteroidota bacterium]
MKHIIYIVLAITISSCNAQDQSSKNEENMKKYPIQKSEEEWKEILDDQEYHVLREKGTERAFTGDLYDTKEEGTYICAACDNPMFTSETKFESGTGWPSFYAPISEDKIATEEDKSFGMVRTEVLCARCGGHLGHVFNDGPQPTGLRYCLNSAALDFKPAEK